MSIRLPGSGPSRRSVLGAAAVLLSPSGLPPGDRSLVLAADQASRRVILVDVNTLPWQGSGTADVRGLAASRLALWSWAGPEDDSWWAVSEAKYRRWRGREWVLSCATGGLAVLVSFPEGRVRWAARPGGNPHSIELLPDGRVVVASAAPGFLRLYSSAAQYVQYDLAGAHGVHWDGPRELLWAVSDSALTAFRAGEGLEPVRSVPLPTPGGHDLAAVAAHPDRLWVTTNRHVYQYSVSSGTFSPAAGDGPGIKSIGDDRRSGQILAVHPDRENPSPWCTSTLTFTRPDGSGRLARTSLYKARWLVRR
ncbi:DUF6528 family protein [Kitasatospora sp. NPDC002227]|uniref:DUF6528 family protein n=1 Tax=Kitasatospora sp. NPDC002227 TaxID=3154773 RepID=UPI003317ECA9